MAQETIMRSVRPCCRYAGMLGALKERTDAHHISTEADPLART